MTMPKEISLKEFTDLLRKDVDQFESWYKTEQAKVPEHWPEQMGEGDWFEQFLLFMTSSNPRQP